MINKIVDISIGNNVVPLTCYVPSTIERNLYKDSKPAVLILPGGGYEFTYEGEGEPIALRLVSQGVACFVLHYSVRPNLFPQALAEALTALKYIRDNSDKFGINKDNISVMGFSAGGHLAASLGVFWNRPFLSQLLGVDSELIRPNGQILCYPVITSGEKAHTGSFINLLGSDYENPERRAAVSLELHVTSKTPPTFLWHTATDPIVPVENSILFFQALQAAGVPAEMHIYPVGDHGLALATEETAGPQGERVQEECTSWISLAKNWIKHYF